MNKFKDLYIRKLKLICLCSIFVLSNVANAQQKVGFGISLEGSIGLLTSAQKTAEKLYEEPFAPNYPELANKWGVSNSSEFSFDMILPKRNLQFSIGVRVFDWRYTRDSVQGIGYTQNPVTFQTDSYTYYYPVKRTLTNGLPFLSCSYRHGDRDKFNFIHTLSVGYYGIITRVFEKRAIYGSETSEYETVNTLDWLSFKGQKDKSVMDLKLFSGVEKIFNNVLALKFGVSYYYTRNSISNQHGLFVNGAISILFIE